MTLLKKTVLREPSRSAPRSTNPAVGYESEVEGKGIAMISYNTNRDTPHLTDTAFIGADSTISEPRSASIHLLDSSTRSGKHRRAAPSTRMPPTLQNEMAELLADIDGLPILVRLLVQDIPSEKQSEFVSRGADIHSLLSSTLERMVDGIRRASQRTDAPSTQPLAIVELKSSGEHLDRLPVPQKETVLRVGPLELDLIDRIAKRGDRQIDLRPREFQLLRYMMQRTDELLTREILLKEVWHYKFVPETNLVDVHLGRLRRKVDGPNEAPMIRNVRGAGFVLSATPLSQDAPPRPAELSTTSPSETSLRGQ
ncbi:MAG: two-component system, OmpR family, response regulator [Bradyrhizobium sp.]|nr:two-component system, OmpR family, response regulator [Bradyrhizobium sp.]